MPSDRFDLKDQVAVVTGAARGLGAAYVQALLDQGAHVVAVDINPIDTAQWNVAGGDVAAVAMTIDVADARSVDEVVSFTLRRFARLDILVNNASIAADLNRQSLLVMESAEWDRVMAVNARGSFLCLQAAARVMVKQGRGKIINVASGTFMSGEPRMLHYVASKGAVVGMTRVAARELGEHGITVNCLAPGLTMTDTLKQSAMFSGQAYETRVRRRAIAREAVPEDLCGAMLFLASPASDFITGQTLVVDGGGAML